MIVKDEKDAISFNGSINENTIIVPCIATNPKICKYVSGSSTSLFDFWDIKERRENPCPKGTYVADSIKCLE